MIYSRMAGVGSYLPPKIVTNSYFESYLDTSDAWIQERTGIVSRHLAGPTETAASMGAEAAKLALARANISSDEIELIVVATCTPDQTFPSTACLIQENLKIPGGAAFDVQAACSGFIYALSVVDQFIRAGVYKKALVIGTEVMSRTLDWQDRGTCILFGDGAGAVVLEASSTPGILSTHLNANGEHRSLLYLNNPQVKPDPKIEVDPYLRMQGSSVFRLAVKWLGQVAIDILSANQMSPADIDWVVPHQANIRIIQATADKLNLSMEQVIVTVDRHGNTSGASIPLALDFAIQDGRIQRGHKILLEAFGGGLTWGAALVEY